LIKRSFQEISGAVKTIEIVKELIEIDPNEVCDNSLTKTYLYNGIMSRRGVLL